MADEKRAVPPKLDLTPEQTAAMRRAAAMDAPDIAALPPGHPVTVLRAENAAMNARIAANAKRKFQENAKGESRE